ncbi:MAG: hypothetical protein WAO71_05000 [Gallionella sp.]
MAEKPSQFFEKCSFLTQVMLKGWGKDGNPIWRRPIAYDNDSWPIWDDWNETRNKYIAPLCGVADGVTIFGVEWRSDKRELLELVQFVDEHFKKQGRYLVCNLPTELTDAPIFWTGGSMKHFSLIKVMSFSMEHLGFVLDTLCQHNQAGKMSSRYGGAWTSANNFAKSVVKKSGFAVIVSGNEAEVYFPIEYKGQVEEVAQQVEARRGDEAKMVKQRMSEMQI